MKLSEMEGKTLTVKINGSDTMIAVLKEIRPIGFVFEVKSSDSGTYCAGQHVFMSTSCPIAFSTI